MGRRYYYLEVTNPNSGSKVRVTAADKFSLANKVERLEQRWERERVRNIKAEKQQQALEMTEELEDDILAIKTILQTALQRDDKLDWGSLRQTEAFPTKEPIETEYHKKSLSKSLSFIGTFKKKAETQFSNEKKIFEKAQKDFLKRKTEWEESQKKYNEALESTKHDYEKGTKDGVEKYINMVLDRSAPTYPDVFTINSELAFDENTATIVVDVDLPSQTDVPENTSFRYVSARDIIEPKHLSLKDFVKLYDDVIYQIILRFLHEIFESDYKEHVKAIVLNGNAPVLNKGTGETQKKTVATIQVQREEFVTIDLSHVVPYACFRHFKGVSAGSLVELTPVKPILKINKSDGRIIEASNVLEEFDSTQNLATMDWEKFEVLVRDLFQKMFGATGASVEVTRASRDAGVDALAFDEDPIRGGKFVIQAKRYNNLVPVSAVRDLYGTVLNEGAVKGILVTTSYYGPDAVKFAKDKPLTLINGEELLYLLQKHGHDFRIEIQKKRSASSKLV